MQLISILIAYSPVIFITCVIIIFGLFTYYLSFKVLGKSRIAKIIIWITMLLITIIFAVMGGMILHSYLNPSIQGPETLEEFLRYTVKRNN
jgi:hypothetical protein